jgi:predicted DNA-binding transcriptional regulator AlpA
MLTKEQESELISRIPKGTIEEDLRVAYSVVAGLRDDKSPAQVATYYSASIESVNKWFKFFEVEIPDGSSKKGKGRKGKDLSAYMKNNTGRVITPKIVADEVGISLPTFYNYYNANRHLFKKVKRGEFQIADPKQERAENKK